MQENFVGHKITAHYKSILDELNFQADRSIQGKRDAQYKTREVKKND